MICGRYLNFWRLNMMRQFLGIFTYCDFDCTPLLYTTKNSNEETNKLIANEESCWQQKILNLVTKIWLNEMRGNERIKEDHDCLFISFCFVTKSFSRKKSPISKSWFFTGNRDVFTKKITKFEFLNFLEKLLEDIENVFFFNFSVKKLRLLYWKFKYHQRFFKARNIVKK